MLGVLTPTMCAEIIARLLPIGDQYYKFSSLLVEMGFTSIQVLNNLFEPLAVTESELSLHRSICIDLGKESFAYSFRPGDPSMRDENISPFKSELLADMRKHRSGLLFRQRAMEWEVQLRHRVQSQAEFFACREQEIIKFLTPPHSRLKVDDDEARNVAKCFLAEKLQLSGFLPLPLSQKDNRIILAKHLCGDWWLKFLAFSQRWDCTEFTPMYQGIKLIIPNQVEFGLLLSQEKNKQKPSSSLKGIPIRFADFSPLGDFLFSRYTDMDECAVGILGYVKLYQFMAQDLEGSLADYLKKI